MSIRASPKTPEMQIRQRMLSGQPFTYERLVAWAEHEFSLNDSCEKVVDRILWDLVRDNFLKFDRRHAVYVLTMNAVQRQMLAA